MTLANTPIVFKVGLQGLTAQSTTEVELVAAAMTMKEAAFCSNMMALGFGESFGIVPLYVENTLALDIASNRTYSPRAKPIALRYSFFVQELVGEGKVIIHYGKSEDQLAGLGTKPLSKHRHPNLINLINEFKA